MQLQLYLSWANEKQFRYLNSIFVIVQLNKFKATWLPQFN